MMNVVSAVVSGLFVGALARFFYPGAVEMGWLMTIGLGVAGSLVAGLIGSAFSPGGIKEGFSRAGCFTSLLGAMALIFLARTFGWG